VHDAHRQDGTGKTALQRARAAGQASCERILREDAPTVEPAELIESASQMDTARLTELLKNGGKRIINAIGLAGQTALFVAACAGNVAAVQILLDNGASSQQLSVNAESPLHGAAGELGQACVSACGIV
jgi:ankyrin repeat protein